MKGKSNRASCFKNKDNTYVINVNFETSLKWVYIYSCIKFLFFYILSIATKKALI